MTIPFVFVGTVALIILVYSRGIMNLFFITLCPAVWF